MKNNPIQKTQKQKTQIYLWRPDFDKEAAAFVRDLEHFGPRETVDPQLVLVNHQATGANPERNVNTIKILCAEKQDDGQWYIVLLHTITLTLHLH